MIRKLLEAFFQHKLLLLLPAVLIPGIVTPIALAITPPAYETTVSVWIDRPAYLNYKDGTNQWISAVQNQSGRLTELLRTRAFVNDVAQRTSLAPLVNSAAGQTRINDLITRGVTIGNVAGGVATAAASEHLLVIRVQAATAQLSYELCKSIVDAYQEKTAADQADQASVAVDFYQSRLQDAQKQLNKVSQDLRRYTASQSDSFGSSPPGDPAQANLPAAMLDPKLGAIQATVQAAQLEVTTAQAALNQAQQDAMTSVQGQQYGFQVIDTAELPTAPTNQIKKIIVYPIAAAIAGLALSALLLVLLVAGDRSVRSELDLAPGVRSLGTIPVLRLKNVPKNLRAVATRRAIGATAGMALPAAGAK
jgi:capsular polysaccharide biosynthesis protein